MNVFHDVLIKKFTDAQMILTVVKSISNGESSHFVKFPLCQFPLCQFPICQHWPNLNWRSGNKPQPTAKGGYAFISPSRSQMSSAPHQKVCSHAVTCSFHGKSFSHTHIKKCVHHFAPNDLATTNKSANILWLSLWLSHSWIGRPLSHAPNSFVPQSCDNEPKNEATLTIKILLLNYVCAVLRCDNDVNIEPASYPKVFLGDQGTK